ncbi:MAG: hypothetical protein WBV69_23675 [Candidatus Sulfotelmatobacter sp.]
MDTLLDITTTIEINPSSKTESYLDELEQASEEVSRELQVFWETMRESAGNDSHLGGIEKQP